jgi:hypothetical protein
MEEGSRRMGGRGRIRFGVLIVPPALMSVSFGTFLPAMCTTQRAT